MLIKRYGDRVTAWDAFNEKDAAGDFISNTDVEIMGALMKRVKRARFILLPENAGAHGHSSGGDPSLWKQYLAELMR